MKWGEKTDIIKYNTGLTPLCVCKSRVILYYICFFFPFHVVSAVNLCLKQTALLYLITVTICCHNTDLVHVNGHDRIILVIFSQALYKAPRWWMLCDLKHVASTFKYFIILIVSTNYILCISWVIRCLRGDKHSDYIRCGECLWVAEKLSASHEGLYSLGVR